MPRPNNIRFSETENQMPKKIPNNPKKSTKCSTCGKTYSDRNNLSKHINVHSIVKKFPCTITTCSF